MADVADRADGEIDRAVLESRRKVLPAGPQPTGWCLWCEEPVEDHARWCSIECREDWDKDAGLRRQGLRA